MSDSDVTSTLDPDAPTAPAHQPTPRFRDRMVGMRGVVAVALACVVLGGVGGAALGAASHDGRDGFRGPGGFPAGRPGQPGRFQPGPGQFQPGPGQFQPGS